MEKAFSVASWNVEHFGISRKIGKNKRESKADVNARIKRVIEFIKSIDSDILAIYEVRSSVVFEPIVSEMPKYQFYITEGEQTQEILIGIKNGINAFITQKLEFKSGRSTLRPGVLVTVSFDDQFYQLLFLHLKSLTNPVGFGLRDDMIERACNFREKIVRPIREMIKEERKLKKLPKISEVPQPNYIYLGDLNVMGLDYNPGKKFDIPSKDEIAELKRRTKKYQMRVLSKTRNATYYNGSKSTYKPSDLDHVVAANHLKFKQIDNADVKLKGWPELDSDAEKDKWIRDYSDHALLYFEVLKVAT